ncbi:MAG: serine hydrolase [Pseudomonadota bacterium]
MKRLLKSALSAVTLLAGFHHLAWAENPPETSEVVSSSLGSLAEAGQIAIFTCSGLFIAERSLEELQAFELTERDDLPYTVKGQRPDIRVDEAKKIVSVPFTEKLPPMRAAYRDGLGCSVLPFGAGEEEAAQLPKLSHARPQYEKGDLGWPSEGAIQVSKENKPYQKTVKAIVGKAFDGKTYGEGTRSTGVVVVHQGRVIAENYRDGFGPHTQYRSWSTAKSLASAVIGVAIKDGIIDGVEVPALVPEWTGDDPRRAITLENLLHMSSGLKTNIAEDGSISAAVYWMGANALPDMTSQPLVHQPGEEYHYANYDTLLLMRSLKTALGDDQAYLDFPYERLFDRIGMHDTFAETDAYGNYIMSSQVYTTARDLTRFAHLFLNDGVMEGERILPEGWVEYSCTASTTNPNYAAQWWLHEAVVDKGDQRQSLKFCHTAGFRGQTVTFVPELDLIIARTGVDPVKGQRFDSDKFFEDIAQTVMMRKTD